MKAKENMGPLLTGAGDQMIRDMEKSETLSVSLPTLHYIVSYW